MLRLPRFLRWEAEVRALNDLALGKASSIASPVAWAIGLATSAWDRGEA